MAASKPCPRLSVWLAVALVGSALLAALLIAQPAQAGQPRQETEKYCLSCHANPDLSMTLPSGEAVSLFVDPAKLAQSLHSPAGIECEACHTDITTFPHPKRDFQNARELSRAYYLACQKCHSANYQRAQDSIHTSAAAEGNLEAPVCTDCHGAHDVRSPSQPRSKISTTCGQCHTEIFTTYQQSVHGAALFAEDNPDVPVCTDCHGVHNIQDSRTEQFSTGTPELCAQCHADPQLMGKYNLPSDVYDLYRLSWHGVDVSVFKARWPTIWHDTAVCTDCHGTHNIRKTSDPQSMVNPANLLATCQACHPGVGPNWTGAWTGHHPVSVERTPFLFYTQVFYNGFMPFVLGGSVIYVALQAIRATLERARRSMK